MIRHGAVDWGYFSLSQSVPIQGREFVSSVRHTRGILQHPKFPMSPTQLKFIIANPFVGLEQGELEPGDNSVIEGFKG